MSTNKMIEDACAEAMRIRDQKEKGFLGRLRRWRRETDWESVLFGLFFFGLYAIGGMAMGAALYLIIKCGATPVE